MIKANTTILIGSKSYCRGQIVTGLSKTDKEWMKRGGYITETSAGKKGETSEVPAQKAGEQDEF